MGTCTVSGTIKDVGGNAEPNVRVRAILRARGAWNEEPDPDTQIGDVIAEALTDANGDWSMVLTANDDFSPADTVYEFQFTGKRFEDKRTVTVPDQATVKFTALTQGAPEG